MLWCKPSQQIQREIIIVLGGQIWPIGPKVKHSHVVCMVRSEKLNSDWEVEILGCIWECKLWLWEMCVGIGLDRDWVEVCSSFELTMMVKKNSNVIKVTAL